MHKLKSDDKEQEVKKNQESDHWRIFYYRFPRVDASFHLSTNKQKRGRKQANNTKQNKKDSKEKGKQLNWLCLDWSFKSFTNRIAVCKWLRRGKKEKGSKARQQRLADLFLMSYSCRKAWQVLTHQLVVFLPYKGRTKKEGQRAIQVTHACGRQLRNADLLPTLSLQHLLRCNSKQQLFSSCIVWTFLKCFLNKIQMQKKE